MFSTVLSIRGPLCALLSPHWEFPAVVSHCYTHPQNYSGTSLILLRQLGPQNIEAFGFLVITIKPNTKHCTKHGLCNNLQSAHDFNEAVHVHLDINM